MCQECPKSFLGKSHTQFYISVLYIAPEKGHITLIEYHDSCSQDTYRINPSVNTNNRLLQSYYEIENLFNRNDKSSIEEVFNILSSRVIFWFRFRLACPSRPHGLAVFGSSLLHALSCASSGQTCAHAKSPCL